MANAREEADELRTRLENDIREDLEEKRAAWQTHLQDERDTFLASLQRQAGKRLLEITERVLADYADTDTAERVVATFAERLKALDEDAREKMKKAASAEGATALVQTGTALGSAAKGRITRAIHEILAIDIDVDYREDREMVFGVRLTIGDDRVEWSAMRYLKRLGVELGEIIDAGRGRTDGGQDTAEDDSETSDDVRDGASEKEDHETA